MVDRHLPAEGEASGNYSNAPDPNMETSPEKFAWSSDDITIEAHPALVLYDGDGNSRLVMTLADLHAYVITIGMTLADFLDTEWADLIDLPLRVEAQAAVDAEGADDDEAGDEQAEDWPPSPDGRLPGWREE